MPIKELEKYVKEKISKRPDFYYNRWFNPDREKPTETYVGVSCKGGGGKTTWEINAGTIAAYVLSIAKQILRDKNYPINSERGYCAILDGDLGGPNLYEFFESIYDKSKKIEDRVSKLKVEPNLHYIRQGYKVKDLLVDTKVDNLKLLFGERSGRFAWNVYCGGDKGIEKAFNGF